MQIRLLLICAVLAAGATFASGQPLSGAYTIGGANADFDSIGHAVDSLIVRGVSGPVLFNLRSGTYTEQVVIPQISGASASNTVTFQSESGNAEDVLWQFAPTFTQNYLVLLDGADHVRFQNLSFYSGLPPQQYSRIIVLQNAANDVQVRGNIFRGHRDSAAGLIVAGTTNAFSRLLISDNEFYQFYFAIHLTNANTVGAAITGNRIDDANGDTGIFVSGCDSLLVADNLVNARDQAIRSDNCPNRLIQNNRVTARNYGLFIVGGGAAGAARAGLVANNFVIAGTGNAAAGIMLNGNISGLKVFHNTVYCTEPVLAGGAALLLFQPATTQGPYRLINNLFIHAGAGLALRAFSTGANFEIDHNNYYSNGANLANWVGTLCTDLAALQAASRQNQNSVSKEIEFEDPADDLHLSACSVAAADLKGIGLPEVPRDIDGQIRDMSDPCMGADETFDVPPNLFTTRRTYEVYDHWHFDSGDLDGDGDVDIAVATGPGSDGPGYVTMLWNNGAGNFTVASPLPIVNDFLWKVKVADLDGDGRAEMIALADSLWLLRSLGNGNFTAPRNISLASIYERPIDLAFGDLDNDNDLDISYCHGDDGRLGRASLFQLENLGGGNYGWYYTNPNVVEVPVWHRLADVNNDGFLDALVMDSPNNKDLSVNFSLGLDNDGFWRGFSDLVFTYNAGGICPFVAADFDGDNDIDVITLNHVPLQFGVNRFGILRNTGAGGFAALDTFATDEYRVPQYFVALDYEDDGDEDIVTVNRTGDLSLLLNDGAGNFTRVVACDTAGALTATFWKDMLSDDFNNDGRPDVALLHANGGNDSLTVYLNAGWSLPTSVKDRRRSPAPIGNFVLYQNYPNPFNPSTVISYQLAVNSKVNLAVYDLAGRLVRKLIAGQKPAGRHQAAWDATDDNGRRVASGVYLYRLQAGDFVQTRKLVVVR
jgi:hypothetical protein